MSKVTFAIGNPLKPQNVSKKEFAVEENTGESLQQLLLPNPFYFFLTIHQQYRPVPRT
jgi:hypothetical protein